VRARAVLTSSLNVFIDGCSATNCDCSAALVGTVWRSLANSSWLASEFRHCTILAAFSWRALSPVCGTVHVSPPRGETTVAPDLGAGTGTTS
jgi:hypothetical protein